MPTGTYAIVRGVPNTYDECIRPPGSHEEIDVNLAREQHTAYCETLRHLGLRPIYIDPDDRFPDCCFVEDTAVIIDDKAVIMRMEAQSRIGEEVEVAKALAQYKRICRLEAPGTMDGGDVLTVNTKIYVGVGKRTNESAIEQIREFASASGYQVIPVRMKGILHLKSACTYIGNDCLVVLPGHFDVGLFGEYKIINVPQAEAYAANCLSVNGKVLVSSGYSQTKRSIESKGFETIDLEMSEFRKGNGSLTCLSKIF